MVLEDMDELKGLNVFDILAVVNSRLLDCFPFVCLILLLRDLRTFSKTQ